jgi:hypothetical protein
MEIPKGTVFPQISCVPIKMDGSFMIANSAATPGLAAEFPLQVESLAKEMRWFPKKLFHTAEPPANAVGCEPVG